MRQVSVKLNDVEQIKKFVNVIDKFDVNFDLGAGQRVVDAKSILGVMALDLSQPQLLRYDSDDERIEETISPFLLS